MTITHYFRMRSEVDLLFEGYKSREGTKDEVGVTKIECAAGPLRQLRFVTQRAFRNLVRNPQATIMQCMVMVIFAFLNGIIFFQIDDSATYGIQNR